MFNGERSFVRVLVGALTASCVSEGAVPLGGAAPEAVGHCSETGTKPERAPARRRRTLLPRCEQRQRFATVSAVRADIRGDSDGRTAPP